MHSLLHETLSRAGGAERIAPPRRPLAATTHRARRTRRALAAAVAIFTAAGTASAAEPGTTLVVDQPTGLTDPLRGLGNQSDANPGGAVSADGRYVVFASDADGLSTADDDRRANVFRKDRLTGEVVLVSVSTDEVPANANGLQPQISDDGRQVLFVTGATNLDRDASDGDWHAFVRDVAAGTTTLASRAQGKLGEPGEVVEAAISGDGRTVAFSTPDRMQLADDNGKQDVYARRVAEGDTVLVSRADGAAGAISAEPSREPSVNRDGSRVAFTTPAKLVTADGNGYDDVYRRNLAGATTDLISARDGDGKAGNGSSSEPAISRGGDTVAFASEASDLDAQYADDPNGRSDVFVRAAGDQRHLSHDLFAAAAGRSSSPDISGDLPGRVRVAFSTTVRAADPTKADETQVWARDVGGAPQLLSRAGAAGPAGDAPSVSPSLAQSGDVVAFATRAGNLGAGLGGDATDVAVRDIPAGTTSAVSVPDGAPLAEDLSYVDLRSGAGQITPDARYVVFEAGHDALGIADRGVHVFRRDVRTGTTILADRADGPDGAPAENAASPSVSADGRLVAFETESPLAAEDKNGQADVYVRDLVAGTTRLVSKTPAGAAGNGESADPMISADGRRVAFDSDANDLGDGDTDSDGDVFVRDLAEGVTIYASRAAAPADGDSYFPVIDADGSTVAFESTAKNLDPADADAGLDVFVRDLAAGTTKLASRATGGAKGDDESGGATISADGRLVAFASNAKNLDDDPDAGTDVFVRDVVSGTTRLVSRASGADGANANGFAAQPSISADGTAVSFRSSATNLGVGQEEPHVYVRRLDGLTTTPVAQGSTASLSGDGSCAVFSSDSPSVIRSSPDYERVLLRAVRATCDMVPATAGDAPPQISRASLLRGRFAVGTPRARGRRGTKVRYTLSEAATVTLKVHKRAGKRLRPKGAMRRAGAAGRNRVPFSGRLRGHTLAPGRYRLTLVARDAAGQRSAPVRLRFRVVAGGR